MGTIKDESTNYKAASKVKNISELPEVDVNLVILEEPEAEFPYRYIEVNGERYKMPTSVLANLKAILAFNPNLKKFRVQKQGEGMDTRYFVVPLI